MLESLIEKISGRVPKGIRRSPQWKRVRAFHLAHHPTCAACGRKSFLQVHHIIPFHVAPNLELEPENLLTLCSNPIPKYGISNCHFLFGHFGNWRKYNSNVEYTAHDWLRAIKISVMK